jgi:hypothetical protein
MTDTTRDDIAKLALYLRQSVSEADANWAYVNIDVLLDAAEYLESFAFLKARQSDETLRAIRENTPRYRMSIIVSTHDSAIDTRLPVIWSALNLKTEILESVSLPEKLPPLGSQ